MSGYFDRVEAQLAALTREGAHLDQPARGRRPGWGTAVIALAVTLAVAIAVVIVIAVKAHAPARRPATHRSALGLNGPGYPLGAVPTLQQLLDNFAVLRRPQTAQDRSLPPVCGCVPPSRELSRLTRLAVSLPGGYRVFLDVQQFAVLGQRGTAAGPYDLDLDIVDPRGGSTSEAFGASTGYSVRPIPSGGLRRLLNRRLRSTVWASIVPDGVATVSWTFECLAGPRMAGRCRGVPPGTFVVPAVANVAARAITGCGGCAVVRSVVWRAADGSVVASFPGYGNLPAPPFVTGGLGSRTLRILLPHSLGNVHLGGSAQTSVHAIAGLLGPPADANVATGGCGIDHESVWTSPAVADPLTVFERHGRFVGYRYGAPVREIGLERGPGAVLTTRRGLTLDATVKTARRLYPGALTVHAANGIASLVAGGDGGALRGYVLPLRYPVRSVADDESVATIGAGQTGCAAAGRP